MLLRIITCEKRRGRGEFSTNFLLPSISPSKPRERQLTSVRSSPNHATIDALLQYISLIHSPFFFFFFSFLLTKCHLTYRRDNFASKASISRHFSRILFSIFFFSLERRKTIAEHFLLRRRVCPTICPLCVRCTLSRNDFRGVTYPPRTLASNSLW